METSPVPTKPNQFISRVVTELQRAERYSIFVSLTIFDLSMLGDSTPSHIDKEIDRVCGVIRNNVRSVDFVGLLPNALVGMLLPETSRQGAEIVVKRVVSLVKEQIANNIEGGLSDFMPLEIASYPDAGGSRTVRDFLQDWADSRKN